jgi:hypothetical protein
LPFFKIKLKALDFFSKAYANTYRSLIKGAETNTKCINRLSLQKKGEEHELKHIIEIFLNTVDGNC